MAVVDEYVCLCIFKESSENICEAKKSKRNNSKSEEKVWYTIKQYKVCESTLFYIMVRFISFTNVFFECSIWLELDGCLMQMVTLIVSSLLSNRLLY